MSDFRYGLIVGLVIVLGPASGWAMDTDARLYIRLTHEVRCLVCQNQTIADSNAPLAADLRREIRQMLEEGRSENEVTTFLLDRYGDFVLYKPRFKASTAALWLAPGLLLLIGGLGLGRIIRRRRGLPVPADDDEGPPEAAQGEPR